MLENVLKRRRVILGAVGIVVALVLLLSFRCGGEETLTILYWQAPSTPNPYLSGGFKDRDAGAITLQPLAYYDPDGALVPALSEDIPTLENGGISQDLTSITWNLKDDLKWSDGSDLTAHDVVFTWHYCTDEATGCTGSAAFADITSVEALDDSTVKITFHAPTPTPTSAFVGAGSRFSAKPSSPTALAPRPRIATMRTSPPWARAPTASSSSPPTNWPSTNATPTTTETSPFSTASFSRAAARPLLRPSLSSTKARPTTPGTSR